MMKMNGRACSSSSSSSASSASARSTGHRQQSSCHQERTGSMRMFHYKTPIGLLTPTRGFSAFFREKDSFFHLNKIFEKCLRKYCDQIKEDSF